MKADHVARIVRDIPHTREDRGRQLHAFVVAEGTVNCLELGVAHGVGSTWIAAALDEIGGGRLIAIDNESALQREPRADQLLKRAGLRHLVELHCNPHSYNWQLLNLVSTHKDSIDFVFLDGSHNYEIDGCALYFIRILLRKGGWLLIDDLDWSYDSSPTLQGTAAIKAMPDDMRTKRHMRMLWEDTILTDPSYNCFIEDGNWGWARKAEGADQGQGRYLTIRRDYLYTWRRWLARAARKVGLHG